MQAVEGEIDSAHVSWLHAPLQAGNSPFRGRFNDSIIRDGAPKLTVKPTDYGFCYGARRDVDRANITSASPSGCCPLLASSLPRASRVEAAAGSLSMIRTSPSFSTVTTLSAR
jgi:hypothetical protein